MAWFKRTEKGITTATEDKKDVPKGLWYKSPTGKIIDQEELERNLWVSPEDGFHVRIGSKEYFEILLKRFMHQIKDFSCLRRNKLFHIFSISLAEHILDGIKIEELPEKYMKVNLTTDLGLQFHQVPIMEKVYKK